MPTPNEGGAPAPSQTSARDELIAKMAAKVAEARASALERQEAAPVAPPEEPPAEAPPEPVAAANPDIGALLADFVVVSDGKPMLKLKVDGGDRLVPFDTARATLQKNEAADRRLQQAAEQTKLLKQREEQIQAREADFAARTKSQLPSKDAGDQNLDEEARQLAHSLLNATEDEVAASLKKFLSHRQAAPAVDQDEIITKAVRTAEERLTAKTQEREIATGFKQFQRDYPDIAADAKLFKVADGMTDEIAVEHPEWSPAEVMLEAGKRTKAWVDSFKPAPTPPVVDRQTRKEELRPMPQARTARQNAPEPEKPKSPQEILMEIRKARGQAV